MMNCTHCGGKLTRSEAPFHIDRGGIHLQLDKVPAWVCNQCGETMLDEAAVESIQAIVGVADEQVQRLRKSA